MEKPDIFAKQCSINHDIVRTGTIESARWLHDKAVSGWFDSAGSSGVLSTIRDHQPSIDLHIDTHYDICQPSGMTRTWHFFVQETDQDEYMDEETRQEFITEEIALHIVPFIAKEWQIMQTGIRGMVPNLIKSLFFNDVTEEYDFLLLVHMSRFTISPGNRYHVWVDCPGFYKHIYDGALHDICCQCCHGPYALSRQEEKNLEDGRKQDIENDIAFWKKMYECK